MTAPVDHVRAIVDNMPPIDPFDFKSAVLVLCSVVSLAATVFSLYKLLQAYAYRASVARTRKTE